MFMAGHDEAIIQIGYAEAEDFVSLDAAIRHCCKVHLSHGWRFEQIARDPAAQRYHVMLKLPAFRSKKMLEAAKGQSCVNCGVNDDTIVACHYQGMRADAFGRGKGRKAHDLLVADLCSGCHSSFDNYSASMVADPLFKKIDLSELFMYCVLMTLIRRVRQGVLTAKGFEDAVVQMPSRQLPETIVVD
jgi:hypothetical protein